MNTQELKSELESKFPGGILKWEEKNPRRIYLSIRPGTLRKLAGHLHGQLGIRFSTASGVHLLKGFEVLYHFSLDRSGVVISLRVKPGKADPEIDSIVDLVPAADWIEREMAELLGIKFRGRPSTDPLLTSEEWTPGVFPLRKNGR